MIENKSALSWSLKLIVGVTQIISLSGLILLNGCHLAPSSPDPSDFRTISINLKTLVVTPQQTITFITPSSPAGYPPPTGVFYSIFTDGNRNRSLDHVDTKSNRYGFLEMRNDFTLTERTKRQELLTGPFGTVYANTEYYYFHPDSRGWTGFIQFDVSPYANEQVHEPPQLRASLPGNLSLDAVSIIRVFHFPPGYPLNSFIVATANYDANGSLSGLILNIAKKGDWVSQSELANYPASFGFSNTMAQKTAQYGFPAVFPITNYVCKPSCVWPIIASNTLTVVNLHYARNQWVRQDSYLMAIPKKTRFLTYAVTTEDIQLKLLDKTLPFGFDAMHHRNF